MLKKPNHPLEFIVLSVIAFGLVYIPYVHVPFSWTMTFFHEISHGMAALMTGGSIEKIVLNVDGSGLCYTRGGWRFITAFAGYSGAVLWGMLLFYIAQSNQQVKVPATLLAALLVFSAIFYARDVVTWGILAIIFTLFMLIIKLRNATMARLSLQFIGLFVLFDAIRAPLYLFDGRHVGDGATLQNITMIPEALWIIIWLLIGIAGVVWLWLLSQKRR